jgi:hypothetical protein
MNLHSQNSGPGNPITLASFRTPEAWRLGPSLLVVQIDGSTPQYIGPCLLRWRVCPSGSKHDHLPQSDQARLSFTVVIQIYCSFQLQ